MAEKEKTVSIPRELASLLRNFTYIGTPGTAELGRVVREANNEQGADIEDVFVAGQALLKVCDELTKSEINKGYPASKARAAYRPLREAGLGLLALLKGI